MTKDIKAILSATTESQNKGISSFTEEHDKKLNELIKAQEELRNYRQKLKKPTA